MFKQILLVILTLSLVSCASRARLKSYEKDIDGIRNEVRNIRIMTDEMRAELGNMRKSMDMVDESVKFQADEIEIQRQYHERLKEVVDGLKDSVVVLESEKLPAKREELREIRSNDTAVPYVVKTEQDGAVTKMYTEPQPSEDSVELPGPEKPDAARQKPGFGYAVKDGVILWQYPSTKSDVLEILVSWQQLSLLEKITNAGMTWWKVKTNDYTGYVNSRFIIISGKK
ncbi:hypothetical protein Dacet_1714 [Denitrovibrio acetiphilus DSM 12809]|uniref:SH3b domain-containing protein n=1 Tax=Denitrovibrio acetiphilus (strain DSM 12809 / NBRC 114555 / N2460) TaxID=522772 RepID=D4H8X9_DENA2|nr:SH3 domain-containing protein [Denitrovibrio acetiphilus]ADD68478.1 hypothetical protein Dacet_1714 [Denitrovibrio acetiphilus DSM 12809]